MPAAEDLKINQGCIVYARRAFVLLLPTWYLKHWLSEDDDLSHGLTCRTHPANAGAVFGFGCLCQGARELAAWSQIRRSYFEAWCLRVSMVFDSEHNEYTLDGRMD
jgi:hypothetical protein